MYENLRLEALKLAVQNAQTTDVSVVLEKAEAFIEFVTAGVENMPATVPSEPGTKRAGRKPKAETIAAPAEAPQTANAPAASKDPTPEPVVDYKLVQEAVLALITLNRKDLVIAVLNEFGVPTALQLKPEQYGEALAAFKKAAVDAETQPALA